MGRYSDNKPKKSVFKPKRRGAFARHLASQIDTEGNNMGLLDRALVVEPSIPPDPRKGSTKISFSSYR